MLSKPTELNDMPSELTELNELNGLNDIFIQHSLLNAEFEELPLKVLGV